MNQHEKDRQQGTERLQCRLDAAEARAEALSQDVNNVHADAQRFAELARAAEARAYAAEAHLAELQLRAEAAEKDSIGYQVDAEMEYDRAKAAEARLAEFIRELRTEFSGRAVDRILHKYKVPK